MTYFKEALSAPALHFRRLKLAEPLISDGSAEVRRTHSAIETKIEIEGRKFLLCLPFQRDSLLHIKALEDVAQERSRGPLIENRILGEELRMVDSLGHEHLFDVVLQELPQGEMLKEAVNHYRADDLIKAVRKMKEGLDAIGFRHNNLTPSNIIICNSGIARPLRYWYAEWETFSDNDISQVLDFIDHNRHDELDTALSSLLAQDCNAEYRATPSESAGIRARCQGHRYGFVDGDGHQITPFVYSWASDFCEGRAIVVQNNKMGAIDSNGKKIIPAIYTHLEFDIETGFFTAIRDQYRYTINYEGKAIRRVKIQSEECCQEGEAVQYR